MHYEFTTPHTHYPQGVVSAGTAVERIRCIDADEVLFGRTHVHFSTVDRGVIGAYARKELKLSVPVSRVLELSPVEECTQKVEEKYDFGNPL